MSNEIEAKRQELESLRERVRVLDSEIAREKAAITWQGVSGYPAYAATSGFLLGIFGAMASLLFNVIGSLVAGKNALELIRVYLTFPLGEKALLLTNQTQSLYAVSDSVIVALGCCLYLLTGMLLGIPVYLVVSRFAGTGSLVKRLLVASLISLLIWLVNFYCILSWLQPLLFHGNWIVNPAYLPWWVAATTHLVFGWTIALLYPLGQFTPYRSPVAKP
jgi:hypothetical protein